MVAFGSVDAFWYFVAGAMVALGGALVFWFRRSFRWLVGRLKIAYLEWFSEAIDKHVQPKFDQVRIDAIAAATEVREQLAAHTAEEGEVVRIVVREELGPLVTRIEQMEEKL